MVVKGEGGFDAPQAAFAAYAPGQSPYIHYWLDRQRSLGADGVIDSADPKPPAAPLSDQTAQALIDLVASAFEADPGDPATMPDPPKPGHEAMSE